MKDDGYPHDQFDRFAQDAYLKSLLGMEAYEIIPMLFLDLMNRVNMIEGQAGLILAELERSDETGTPAQTDNLHASTVKALGGAVDMSNILKALMEYYELRYRADEDGTGKTND